MKSKYSKFLTILLIIIIILIIGLGSYLGYNYYKNYKTVNDADKFVSTFIDDSEKEETQKTGDATQKSEEGEEKQTESIANAAKQSTVNKSAKKTRTYKGFNAIGTIEIPKTNVNYPILDDPPTVKKLEVAVSAVYPRYAELNKVGNVVIVGHNYRNGTFFSNNKKLSNGDKIYITDLDGKKVAYTIYNIFQTTVDDTDFYNRDTDGKMEITLSSCTDASNDQRIIVLARAE